MPFPPEPVNTIDWSNIGFKVREGKQLLPAISPRILAKLPKSMAISNRITVSRLENGAPLNLLPILTFVSMVWHRRWTMDSKHTKEWRHSAPQITRSPSSAPNAMLLDLHTLPPSYLYPRSPSLYSWIAYTQLCPWTLLTFHLTRPEPLCTFAHWSLDPAHSWGWILLKNIHSVFTFCQSVSTTVSTQWRLLFSRTSIVQHRTELEAQKLEETMRQSYDGVTRQERRDTESLYTWTARQEARLMNSRPLDLLVWRRMERRLHWLYQTAKMWSRVSLLILAWILHEALAGRPNAVR